MTNTYVPWLRHLEAKGGKGIVNNIDARSLGRVADEIEFLRSRLEPIAKCCSACGRPNAPENRPLWKILAEVAAEHDVTAQDLMPDDRRYPLVTARWHFFYRALCETGASLQTIGNACGGRDHSTVSYGASMWALKHGIRRARAGGLDARAKRTRTLNDYRRRAAG